MAKIGLPAAVGGVGLDVVTATAADVVAPKVIVGADGEAVIGSMPDVGSDVRAIGMGTNEMGLFFNLQEGFYHKTNSRYPWIYSPLEDVAGLVGLDASMLLAGQDCMGVTGTATNDANADAANILLGKTAYVKGKKITGNLTVTSVVSFSVAQYSHHTLIASWARPTQGPWSGIRVMAKQGSYPANVNDGTEFYTGSGSSATKVLAAGTWYIKAWNYMITNAGWIYGGYVQTTVNNSDVKGMKTFTTSGTYTVPEKVRHIDIFCVGAGGGAGTGNNYSGGAGGGYTNTWKKVSVTPGQILNITIGAGSGGTTSINGIYVAHGGASPGGRQNGAAGGSGGGGGSAEECGGGGSDGSSGGEGWDYDKHGVGSLVSSPGGGQGSSTRAFGEPSGTLYAGGGGGKGEFDSRDGRAGAGGGGGRGANRDGVANTGGGSSGIKYLISGTEYYSYKGGSGIAIIRWGY